MDQQRSIRRARSWPSPGIGSQGFQRELCLKCAEVAAIAHGPVDEIRRVLGRSAHDQGVKHLRAHVVFGLKIMQLPGQIGQHRIGRQGARTDSPDQFGFRHFGRSLRMLHAGDCIASIGASQAVETWIHSVNAVAPLKRPSPASDFPVFLHLLHLC